MSGYTLQNIIDKMRTQEPGFGYENVREALEEFVKANPQPKFRPGEGPVIYWVERNFERGASVRQGWITDAILRVNHCSYMYGVISGALSGLFDESALYANEADALAAMDAAKRTEEER